jgi:hypothetical protein
MCVQDDCLGLTAGKITAKAPLWFADTPALFGSSFKITDSEYLPHMKKSSSSKLDYSTATPTDDEEGSDNNNPNNAGNGAHHNGTGNLYSKSSNDLTVSISNSNLFFPMDVGAKALSFSPANTNALSMSLKDPSMIRQSQALEHYLYSSDLTVGSADASSSYSGCVFVGKGFITSLDAAKEISQQKQHAAEGGVFDPATIRLLAMSYRIRGGVKACADNVQAAKCAGLSCRSAVWSTLQALLTYQPSLPVTVSSTAAAPEVTSAVSPGPPNAMRQSSSTSSVGTQGSQSATDAGSTTAHTNNSSILFGASLVGDILLDLVNCGDCQHFVSVCELVGEHRPDILAQSLETAAISVSRQNEAYHSYISLLQKLRLFSEANYIVKMAKIGSPAAASAAMNLHMYCETCGKEIPDSGRVSYCQKCNKGSGLCVLCHKPVRGLFRWCQICAHGGHNECLTKWFKRSPSCPSGCGHHCSSELQEKMDACQPCKSNGVAKVARRRSKKRSSAC